MWIVDEGQIFLRLHISVKPWLLKGNLQFPRQFYSFTRQFQISYDDLTINKPTTGKTKVIIILVFNKFKILCGFSITSQFAEKIDDHSVKSFTCGYFGLISYLKTVLESCKPSGQKKLLSSFFPVLGFFMVKFSFEFLK